MARRVPLTSLKQLSEINLTPLMDLTFILLITFIITFPLIEQGIPVKLPTGNATELSPEDSRTVTIDQDGLLYLDDVGITPERLQQRLVDLHQHSPQAAVMIRADETIAYGNVVDVLKLLKAADITRMALVTQAE